MQHSETHGDMEGTPTSMTDPAIETPQVRKRNHAIHGVRPQDPTNYKPNELEFTVYIQQSSGIVLRIGSVYFIESCTTPFFISRIFTSGIQGETMVTCLRCILSGDQRKITGFCQNFECTISSRYILRYPAKGEFMSQVPIALVLLQWHTCVYFRVNRLPLAMLSI